ncbi:MAG: hypothetical protein ABIK92_12330 [Pseudomonadota bacterium]
MKRSYISVLLCFVISSFILFALPIGLFSQEDQIRNKNLLSSNQITDLQIFLLTDNTSYSKGDEIHFIVEFINRGNSPFRIMIDSTFVGTNIECKDPDGNVCAYNGGYNSWSPKAGVYTGRTYLLKPKEKMNIKMDALVYDNYQLIFSNLFDQKGSNGYQDFKKNNNLLSAFPDKYICAGRIISLLKPNKYKFTYVYEATENDKYWRFAGAKTPQEASVDLLWLGKATSNTVEILIK